MWSGLMTKQAGSKDREGEDYESHTGELSPSSSAFALTVSPMPSKDDGSARSLESSAENG
ncbi:hypothetical protein E2C01_034346 [Portunus trituberculatus]|uniref:Uncharacterized protein n=1 Tax=Portunus trituberculatus TaxID=210409 RepID=A0A5B7F6R3_PORTR|nr:hypothetical protein [Portunus trituberculatus]